MSNKKTIVQALIGAAIGAFVALRIGAPGLLDTLKGKPGAGMPWLAPDPALKDYKPFVYAAIAGWLLFSVYWEYAAKNASQAKSSESGGSRGFHVFLVNMAALLVVLPIRGMGRYVPALWPLMAAGLALEAAGLFLAVWARRHLGRNWSGAISIKVEHELIRTGPYRRLRHPIYTGLLAMYAGMALVTGEWLAAAGVLLAALAYWRKIRLEESVLDTAFGPAYHTYRGETWALVPGLF